MNACLGLKYQGLGNFLIPYNPTLLLPSVSGECHNRIKTCQGLFVPFLRLDCGQEKLRLQTSSVLRGRCDPHGASRD